MSLINKEELDSFIKECNENPSETFTLTVYQGNLTVDEFEKELIDLEAMLPSNGKLDINYYNKDVVDNQEVDSSGDEERGNRLNLLNRVKDFLASDLYKKIEKVLGKNPNARFGLILNLYRMNSDEATELKNYLLEKGIVPKETNFFYSSDDVESDFLNPRKLPGFYAGECPDEGKTAAVLKSNDEGVFGSIYDFDFDEYEALGVVFSKAMKRFLYSGLYDNAIDRAHRSPNEMVPIICDEETIEEYELTTDNINNLKKVGLLPSNVYFISPVFTDPLPKVASIFGDESKIIESILRGKNAIGKSGKGASMSFSNQFRNDRYYTSSDFVASCLEQYDRISRFLGSALYRNIKEKASKDPESMVTLVIAEAQSQEQVENYKNDIECMKNAGLLPKNIQVVDKANAPKCKDENDNEVIIDGEMVQDLLTERRLLSDGGLESEIKRMASSQEKIPQELDSRFKRIELKTDFDSWASFVREKHPEISPVLLAYLRINNKRIEELDARYKEEIDRLREEFKQQLDELRENTHIGK